jgi:hypothetical protein
MRLGPFALDLAILVGAIPDMERTPTAHQLSVVKSPRVDPQQQLLQHAPGGKRELRRSQWTLQALDFRLHRVFSCLHGLARLNV